MLAFQLLLLFLFVIRIDALNVTPLSNNRISSLARPTLFASSSSDDAEKFRETAKKLREEAEALESKLNRKESPSLDIIQNTPIVYTSLKGSTWTLPYRFASDAPKDGEDPVSNYSGKLTVTFLPDGYSELVSHDTIKSTEGSSITVEKVWGWDLEVSEEDGLNYLLFSSNILLPSTDANAPNEVVRYYWQARVESSASNGELSLDDGTVTMKKDVEPPGGFWGAFNGAGILAQFRFVGNFVAKPASGDTQ